MQHKAHSLLFILGFFVLIRHSRAGRKARERAPRALLILFTGKKTMRIDGVSFHRAAGEQGRKKASKAENEWLMSSVGRGKKKSDGVNV